jgi:hypothetical protein
MWGNLTHCDFFFDELCHVIMLSHAILVLRLPVEAEGEQWQYFPPPLISMFLLAIANSMSTNKFTKK